MTTQPSGSDPTSDGDDDAAPAKGLGGSLRAWVSRHPVATVLLVIAVGWLIYTLVIDRPSPDGSQSDEGTSATFAPMETAPRTAQEMPPATGDPHGHEPMGPAHQYELVARAFAQDFANGAPGWWERVSRWTIPALSDAYRTTNPDRVSTGTLEELVEHSAGSSVADFVASYDTGLDVGIRVEFVDGEWKVTSCVPMKTAY